MAGIVAESHWIERKCEQIRTEIRRRHRAGLEHPDAAVRRKTLRVVEQEAREAIDAYLKTLPRRATPHGPILH